MESVRCQSFFHLHRTLRPIAPAIVALLLAGCVRPVVEVVPIAEREPTATSMREAGRERPKKPRPETLPTAPDALWEQAYAATELGRSVEGRAITMHVFGDGSSPTLVFAAIHGNERNTAVVAKSLVDYLREHPSAWAERSVAVIPIANPDGYARKSRTNANGVDLNRNFPAGNWRGGRRRGRYFGSTHAASEPETRAIMRAVERLRPGCVIAIHNIGGNRHCNNYDGPAERLARLMSARNGYPAKANIGYPTPGSFGSWAGIDGGIPVITLELPRRESGQSAWEANREALLAAIRAGEESSVRRAAAMIGQAGS